MSSEDENEKMSFTHGAYFESFAEFEHAFEAWKTKTGSSYRIASSEKVKGGQDIVDTFRYRYVVFNCIHFGDPRMRGTGVRPNQSYLPCGCKSSIRLAYLPDEECLRILKFVGEHTGHQNMDGTIRSRAAFKRLRSMEKDFVKDDDGDEEDAYARQLQLVEDLRKEQEHLLSILNSRRQKKELAPFDPPPINRDTVDFFRKTCGNTGFLTSREGAELGALTKNLLNRKFGEVHQKPKELPAHQPFQQLQPIENDENNRLL